MYKLMVGLYSDVLDMDITDNLVSVEYSLNVLDSNMSIEPGICEQYANIEFLDMYGNFRQLCLDYSIDSYDTQVSIYLIDEDDNDILDMNLRAYDWDIEMFRDTIKLNARDPSYQFNDINVSITGLADRTVDDILKELFRTVGYTFEYAEGVQAYCTNIKLNNCWWKGDTLYNLLQDVCKVAMLRIYWSNNIFVVDKVII